MAVVGQLMVLVGVNNAPLTAGLASSEAQMKGFAARSSSNLAGLRTAALGIGVAAIAGLGLGIKAAASFQEQMATVNTIARLTPEALTDIGDQIRALSVQTGTALPDLTGAFYDLLSVGVPVGQAMEFLANANTLAIGGLSTTNEAVNAITTAINSWGNATGAANLTMDDSAKVMDIFAKTVEIGGLTAAEIPGALANVASSAAALNIPLEEVGAAWAILTTRGFSASEAATSMDAALAALQKRPPGMEKLEKATGKSYQAIAKTQGAQKAMQALVTDAQKFGIELVDVFGRKEALPFARMITGAGAADWEAALTAMFEAGGTASGQAEERMGTFTRQLEILSATVNDLAITIGTALLPPLTTFVEQVSGVIQGAKAWAEANPKIASAILPVVAAIAGLVVVGTSLGVILGALGTVIGIVTSPILLVVGAVVALAAHFGLLGVSAQGVAYHIGATIGDLAQSFLAWIGPLIPKTIAQLQVWGGQIVSWIVARAPAILAQLQTWAAAFVDWIQPMIGQALSTLGQLAGEVGAWIGAQAPGWLAQLGQWAAAFVDWISPMIPKAIDALGDFIGRGIAWVAAQAPSWLAALLRWADAFMAWVAPMIPKMLAALGQLAVQLVSWILQQIPVVALALGRLAIQFAEWVLPQIPTLLLGLGQLAIEVLGWIARQIPGIALAMGKWGLALVGWIIDSIPSVVENLGTWLEGVLLWLQEVPAQIADAAIAIGSSLADGIITGIGDIGGRIIEKIGLGPAGEAKSFMTEFEERFGRKPTPIEFGQFQAGTLPGFAPGSSTMLPVGPPSPAGPVAGVKGSSSTTLNNTTNVYIGDEKIGQYVEKTLFNNASQYNSGFGHGELP